MMAMTTKSSTRVNPQRLHAFGEGRFTEKNYLLRSTSVECVKIENPGFGIPKLEIMARVAINESLVSLRKV